jgi:hypothetical protein
LGPAAWVASVVLAALLYNPLRRYIQGLLDRHYYRERYDYRRTLADFASELSAETNAESMLESLGDRLARTLGVGRVAVFTCGEDGESPTAAYAQGFEVPGGLNLRFLTDDLVEGLRYRAFGDPSDGPGAVVQSIEARSQCLQLAMLFLHRCGTVVRHAFHDRRRHQCAKLLEESHQVRVRGRSHASGVQPQTQRERSEESGLCSHSDLTSSSLPVSS